MANAKIRDLEDAVDAVPRDGEADLFEVVFYATRDEALWLISEMMKDQYNSTQEVLTDLIMAARCRP